MLSSSGVIAASYLSDVDPPLPGSPINRWRWDTMLNASAALPSNGEGVATWNDPLGSQNCTQGSSSARPTFNATWKSRGGATFDGSNDILSRSTSFFTSGQGLTIFVVCQFAVDPDTTDVGSNMKSLLGIQSASGNDQWFPCRYNGSTRTVAWTGGAGVTITGSFGVGTSPCYLVFGNDGSGGSANMKFRANGVSKTTSGGLAATSNTSFAFYLGGSQSNFLACTLGEVIIYNGLLSDVDIQDVEQDYIQRYWDF